MPCSIRPLIIPSLETRCAKTLFCSLVVVASCSLLSCLSATAIASEQLAYDERVASPMKRPAGRELKTFVRIDMAPDAAAPGVSMAIPMSFYPLRIASAERKARYERYGLPPAGYEFVNNGGLYELRQQRTGVRAQTFELIPSPFFAPFMKGLLQGANASIYGDLDLADKIHCFGVCGWGIKGNDISSVLNLPFKRKSLPQLSADFNILFCEGFSLPEDQVDLFTVSGADIAMAQGMIGQRLGWDVMRERFSDYSAWLKELIQRRYDRSVDRLYADVLAAATENSFGLSLRPGTAPVTDIDLTSAVRSPNMTAAAPYRLSYWPKAEQRGILTLSSFSEPGVALHRGATVVYLTPMSILDGTLASVAMTREIVRAFRTHTLLHGYDGDALGDPRLEDYLVESLRRMTRPLWEYLAVAAAVKSLSGTETTHTMPYGARVRLTNNYNEVLGTLLKPPLRSGTALSFDDHQSASYPFLLDDSPDHLFARAVYYAWKGWKKRSTARPVREIARAIAGGYCRKTREADFGGYCLRETERGTWQEAAQDYLTTTSVAAATELYGIDSEELRCQWTDLEWLVEACAPGTSGVAAGGGNGTGGTISVDGSNLKAIIAPFHQLAATNDCAVTKLRQLVVDEGVSAMEGLPWPTVNGEARVFLALDVSIDGLRSLCNEFINETGSFKANRFSYVTTWTRLSPDYLADSAPSRPVAAGEDRDEYDKKVAEARAWYAEDIRKKLNAIYEDLAALPDEAKLAIVRPESDSTVFLQAWPAVDDAGSEASIARFGDVFGYLRLFVNRVRYGRRPSDGDAPGAKKAMQRFVDKLNERVLWELHDVPRQLFQRFLTTEELSVSQLDLFLRMAGQGVSEFLEEPYEVRMLARDGADFTEWTGGRR